MAVMKCGALCGLAMLRPAWAGGGRADRRRGRQGSKALSRAGCVARGCFAALLLAVAGSAAAAFDVEDALARAGTLGSGDPHEVLHVLAPHAASDHPDVAFELAMAHMRLAIEGRSEGEVTRADIQPALDHAGRAARLGSPHAWNLLWMIHANGWGVDADDGVALAYLRRGVDAGETGASLNYAMLLWEGNGGVARDVAAACDMFEALIDDGQAGPIVAHPLGMAVMLGECGEAPDVAAGVAMIERAAEHGVREAAYDMGRVHEFGTAGEVDIDRALEWYARAADLGEARAQWRVGMAWVRGEGRARDSRQAVEWFENSAASGWSDGMLSLAVMYATGDGVAVDPARAAALYRQAADLGNPHALRSLAGMHASGEGMPADPARALALYEQAIGMGADELPRLRSFIEAELQRRQGEPLE